LTAQLRAFPVLVLIALAWIAIPSGASANHVGPYGNGVPYKWQNLQSLGGSISYSLCPLGEPYAQDWRWGIENWDSYLSTRMDFNEFTCGQSVRTYVTWESADECGLTVFGKPATACWTATDATWQPQGGYFLLDEAEIPFDVSYKAQSLSNRTQLSAHEWGHNLSLDHHPYDNSCSLPGVMAYVNAQPPCFYVPAGSEIQTVECVVYDLLP